RLEQQRRTGLELVMRKLEELQQICRLEVFDDLQRRQAADAAVGLAGEFRHRVGLRHVEAVLAADVDHAAIDVDSARLHAARLQQLEEFAAAAADVED